jgi:uncharacterized membrane protein YebE (DUF533 family)
LIAIEVFLGHASFYHRIMLHKLSREERLRLMKFICSFAWADLEVQPEERAFVQRMVRRLQLDEQDQKLVDGWLELPPRAAEVDPTEVPPEHRQLFLEAVRGVIAADKFVDPEELENLALFEQLLP